MPIQSRHPLYEANLPRWNRCRATYEGEDAVKAAGVEFLPKCDPGQDGAEYEAYKARAAFYDAVSRTVDGFVGAVARKPHVIELPAGLDVFTADATAEGTGLNEFIKHLCSEDILMARAGVLVDYDEAQQRAYFALYPAESITNWTSDSIVLHETVYEADAHDTLKQVAVPQFRQLTMVDGAYTVVIWRKAANLTAGVNEWVVHSTVRPTRRGAPLTQVPFIWLSTLGRTARVEKPPLLGLVNLALSHYRTSADLEHGRHFSGMPTLWVTGSTVSDDLRIGAATAIILPAPEAKIGYAEFNGDGLGSLERGLEEKEKKMAALGAAILTTPREGVETAETARIRASGENSLLMGVVTSVEEVLLAALKIAAEWMSVSGTITVQLNKDFVDQQIDPQTLLGLVGAFQAGMISLETFLFSMQQAEMLPPDMVIDEEVKKLKAAMPPVVAPKPAAAA